MFNGCRSLVYFIIDNNKVSSLNSIANSKNLIHLSISNNEISDVKFLSEFLSLQHLDITDNQISNIEFLSSRHKIHNLFISNNPISNIGPVNNLKFLNILYASHLKNIKLDDSFKFHANLLHLALGGIGLKDASFLSNQNSLIRLDLSNNRISNFDFLKDYHSIKHLNFRNNNISEIFPAFYFFEIDGIDLRDNEFGGKLYERPGCVNRFFQKGFYQDFPVKQNKNEGINELERLVADSLYEKGLIDKEEKAMFYYTNNLLNRSQLDPSLYLLKKLHNENSPYFYQLRRKILLVLKNQFAYTKSEIELKNKYKSIVYNIANEDVTQFK